MVSDQPLTHYYNHGERGRFLLIHEILLLVMGELDTGPRPDTISYDDEIIGMTLKVTEVGIKISTTLPCSMLKKVWMAL